MSKVFGTCIPLLYHNFTCWIGLWDHFMGGSQAMSHTRISRERVFAAGGGWMWRGFPMSFLMTLAGERGGGLARNEAWQQQQTALFLKFDNDEGIRSNAQRMVPMKTAEPEIPGEVQASFGMKSWSLKPNPRRPLLTSRMLFCLI